MTAPKSHPRYHSLLRREVLVRGWERGLVAVEGLVAHGRGEAFDYLLGERTIPPADAAERAGAAHLLAARRPVISVNGNTAVLAAAQVAELARTVPARVEVNVFHRTEERVRKLVEFMEAAGAGEVLGTEADARLPGLEQPRAACSAEGIHAADVVLVPLEDGDRAEALAAMGKAVIAIDLNPLSRTSRTATVSITDDVERALVRMAAHVAAITEEGRDPREITEKFDNRENLRRVLEHIAARLRGGLVLED